MTATRTHSVGSTQEVSQVLRTPAAAPGDAVDHFRSRLAFETDPSDLHADLDGGVPGIVVVDARSGEAFGRSHIPGAINLPHREITAGTTAGLDRDALYVTYCWGPGCNSSTKGALRLAELGFRVKELIGGIEYWRREGYEVTAGGSS
jgi:rhodanese-related sulfurtransferase